MFPTKTFENVFLAKTYETYGCVSYAGVGYGLVGIAAEPYTCKAATS